MKKVKVEGKLLEVVDYETFANNKDLYNNTMTAVEKDGVIYPVRNKTDTRNGLYDAGAIDFFIPPTKENQYTYSTDNVIDLNDAKTIAELSQKMNRVRDLEKEILSNPDSIDIPEISTQDTPMMRALKEAIVAKEIDLNKYKDRFGESFANDKRKLKGKDITLFMFNRYTKALDINASLILTDSNPNVANPMNKTIEINLSEFGKPKED